MELKSATAVKATLPAPEKPTYSIVLPVRKSDLLKTFACSLETSVQKTLDTRQHYHKPTLHPQHLQHVVKPLCHLDTICPILDIIWIVRLWIGLFRMSLL